jgi:hypothetical protein
MIVDAIHYIGGIWMDAGDRVVRVIGVRHIALPEGLARLVRPVH